MQWWKVMACRVGRGWQKHARDVFGPFYEDRPADVVITYEWSNSLLEVQHLWHMVQAQKIDYPCRSLVMKLYNLVVILCVTVARTRNFRCLIL